MAVKLDLNLDLDLDLEVSRPLRESGLGLYNVVYYLSIVTPDICNGRVERKGH